MRDRLIDQHPRLFARARQAEQREEGFLARTRILVELFADRRFIALDVEDIVGDLEREAKITRVATQTGAPRIAPASTEQAISAPVFIACSRVTVGRSKVVFSASRSIA